MAILNKVLLIDDDEATNFLHHKLIREKKIAKSCHVIDTGLDAIKYLTTEIDGEYPKPDLILLDINMPVMNGWDFLREYALLDYVKADVVVVVLTTSLNPDDKNRGNSIPDVANFMQKPLTGKMLDELISMHF